MTLVDTTEGTVQTETIGTAAPGWDELGQKLITVIREHAPPNDLEFRNRLNAHLDMVTSVGKFTGCLASLQAGEAYIPGQNVEAAYSR